MSKSTSLRSLIPAVLIMLQCLFGVASAQTLLPGGSETAAEPEQGEGHRRLADLLEDDATRNALIEQLRRAASEEGAEPVSTADPASVSLPGRVADFTQTLAEEAVRESVAAIRSAGEAWERLAQADPVVLGAELLSFATLVGATLVALWLFARVAAFAFRALDNYVLRGTASLKLVRRSIAIIAAIAVHLGAILAAWLAGYGVALFVLGGAGEISMQESLFLNAFLMVELVRGSVRTVFSNRYQGLRLVPTSGENAAYWTAWLSRMVFFLGYGLLLAVPVVVFYTTPDLGRAVAIVIMLLAFLNAAVIVMQNRERVRRTLKGLSARMHTPFARIGLDMAGRIWHIVAIVYLGAVLATAVLYPQEALPFMVSATLQTLLAIVVGVVVSAILGGFILRRIELPEDTRAKFPLLETRLNAYIPTALRIARFTVLAIVVAVVLDAWALFDLGAWVTSDTGAVVIGKIVTVALIIGLALFLWLLVASWIEFKLNPESGHGETTPRVTTLLTIFRNAVAIALVVMTVMVVLAEIGMNIGPLLAGAGVLGLAIGFGAQKLVQDVITGVFIQLEGAINVGDIVTAGDQTGVVEKLTIRSLGLRDLSGTYHLLPFSSVETVSNYNRGFAYHLGEYRVAYREDTDEVIVRLREAFDELVSDATQAALIIGDLEVHGITALNDSSIEVRVRIKTAPGQQWGVGREYNRLVKRHFDAAGIEIPFPHMRVYFGEDKQGNAPPARLKTVSAEALESERPAPPAPPLGDAKANPAPKGDFDEADK